MRQLAVRARRGRAGSSGEPRRRSRPRPRVALALAQRDAVVVVASASCAYWRRRDGIDDVVPARGRPSRGRSSSPATSWAWPPGAWAAPGLSVRVRTCACLSVDDEGVARRLARRAAASSGPRCLHSNRGAAAPWAAGLGRCGISRGPCAATRATRRARRCGELEVLGLLRGRACATLRSRSASSSHRALSTTTFGDPAQARRRARAAGGVRDRPAPSARRPVAQDVRNIGIIADSGAPLANLPSTGSIDERGGADADVRDRAPRGLAQSRGRQRPRRNGRRRGRAGCPKTSPGSVATSSRSPTTRSARVHRPGIEPEAIRRTRAAADLPVDEIVEGRRHRPRQARSRRRDLSEGRGDHAYQDLFSGRFVAAARCWAIAGFAAAGGGQSSLADLRQGDGEVPRHRPLARAEPKRGRTPRRCRRSATGTDTENLNPSVTGRWGSTYSAPGLRVDDLRPRPDGARRRFSTSNKN